MINSRNTADLLSKVRVMHSAFVTACEAEGIDILTTSTYRDVESQNALFAQGRSTPGRIVTNARGGESFHNYRCAFDFVPLVNGKPVWDDIGLITKCGHIAESVGLEWAGNWTKFKEMLHCQYSGGLTIEQLKSGKEVL